MFEHYGFMDALYAVKKHFVYILVAALLFGALGFGFAVAKNTAIEGEDYVHDNQTDVAVAELYLVSGTMEENTQKNQLQYNRDIALMLSSMLNAEYTRQSVFDTVLDEFEVEQLIANDNEIKDKYANKVIKNDIIGEFVTVSVLADTSIVRIYVNTKDEQISECLLELYREKFTSSAEQIKASGVECTYTVIADTKIGTESDDAHEPVSGSVSTKKYALIFAVLGGAVAVCAAFAWTLFFPVINRRADVEGYGTKLVSEKKESLDFVLNNINRDTEQKKIAFVLCKGKADNKKGRAFYDLLSKKAADKGVELVLCKDAASDYAEFERAKECGCAVIAVSYSNTKHTEYQKTVARLSENGIKIIGSVAV